jgi:hypothetical protein
MWFSEKTLVFVDTRSAAVAVYKSGFLGPGLLRFASERFESRSTQSAIFADVLADSAEAVSRLRRQLRAPSGEATIFLPLGASYPAVVDAAPPRNSQARDVGEADLIRFRLSPLLPFPIAQAEVRSDAPPPGGNGAVLAQAIPKALIVESERVMASLGFPRPHVTSTLSAAFRGLPPKPRTVDLIFGDSACAIAVRNEEGAVEAIHLRLLLPGDDRAQRSMDEARRAADDVREVRVLGEDVLALQRSAPDLSIRPAFDEPALHGSADPQRFPFLAVFHARPSR